MTIPIAFSSDKHSNHSAFICLWALNRYSHRIIYPIPTYLYEIKYGGKYMQVILFAYVYAKLWCMQYETRNMMWLWRNKDFFYLLLFIIQCFLGNWHKSNVIAWISDLIAVPRFVSSYFFIVFFFTIQCDSVHFNAYASIELCYGITDSIWSLA